MPLIALDDGHGMETPGRRTPPIPELGGRQIKENEFNREVVKYLDIELKRNGFDTLLVAPGDEDVPLQDRTDAANAANADLYISIHYNAFDGDFSPPTPNGFSAHIYLGHTNQPAGQFAALALSYLSQGTIQTNRGIFENDFHVLRETNMPAVLFELGFMDYHPEALLMANVAFQKECARELAQAVCEFFGVIYVGGDYMSQSHGFDNFVAIATETTYGDSPASGYQWIGPLESFEPEENNNTEQRRSIGVRKPFMLRHGAKEVDGALSTPLQNARLLAYALGNVNSTADVDDYYIHTITPVSGCALRLPSFTVQNYNCHHNWTRNYAGGKIDTLTLSAPAEEAVMIEAEALFSHVDDVGVTPDTVTPETDNYFMFYEGAIKINNSTIANITEFEVEISNQLERRFTIQQSTKPARIEEGPIEITASATYDFVDLSQWENFRDGTPITVELDFVDISDPNRYVKITLQDGLYDTNTIPVNAEELQEQELEAIFSDIEIEVRDTNATLI